MVCRGTEIGAKRAQCKAGTVFCRGTKIGAKEAKWRSAGVRDQIDVCKKTVRSKRPNQHAQGRAMQVRIPA